MPFTTVKPLLTKGADLLREYGASQDNLFNTCHHGLSVLAEKGDTYTGLVPVCACITAHFAEEAHSFVGMLECGEETVTDADAAALHESAFSLVEDMALFMREKKLRCGCPVLAEQEEYVLEYFERCGSWKAGDGSFVTDMYYVRLPIAVMHDLVAKLEAMGKPV